MIYAIQAGENGPIKIGYAKNVKSRMSHIQTGCPEDLKLLGSCETGSDELTEKWLHKLNSSSRLRGEWFKPSYMVRETAEAIQQGKAELLATRFWARALVKTKGQLDECSELAWFLEISAIREKWLGRAQA